MKFIDSKNIGEYVSHECQQRSWGGVDDYTFEFEPEALTKQVSLLLNVISHRREQCIDVYWNICVHLFEWD